MRGAPLSGGGRVRRRAFAAAATIRSNVLWSKVDAVCVCVWPKKQELLHSWVLLILLTLGWCGRAHRLGGRHRAMALDPALTTTTAEMIETPFCSLLRPCGRFFAAISHLFSNCISHTGAFHFSYACIGRDGACCRKAPHARLAETCTC